MDDLLVEFLTETNENLEELDLDLVELERNPNDKALLSKIFRLFHTIKGTCGFLELPRLETVAHHAENVLGRFRDGELDVTPDYVTLIFASIDCIKEIVQVIETTGSEPEGDDTALIAKLDLAYEGKDVGEEADDMQDVPEEQKTEETKAVDPLEEAFGEPIKAGGSFEPEQSTEVETENIKADESVKTNGATPPPPTPAEEKPDGETIQKAPTQSLRVNVDVLENLMTMVSELVLTRNQLLQILRHYQEDSEFTTPLQRLNHVVSDLQEGVMQTRMQPIGAAWSKLPRIIRDLSMELGKKIELEMRGYLTEGFGIGCR